MADFAQLHGWGVMMPPIISIVGTSGSGKTTLIEKLVPEFKKRGYRIGTIKHSHHNPDIDQKGKDSWRHRQAGVDTVILASSHTISMVKDQSCDSLDDLEKYFQDMHLVITEGYKRESRPKIEVYRKETNKPPLFMDDQTLIAVVTNTAITTGVPVFGLDDAKELADLIEKTYLCPPSG
ncbi:MAG: molybdopterin-guanine dinucleotide biosynthesis protein B [Desulfobacterales bacterium]|nr:molybdopterin-guanine dinucleotide biosynthesis protein B [Desulfobacterales bacterium]MDJ0913466.1 molybdopterin-guanine dinucleotide biosynthesis protein B [Desulfobacterales bacterium]